jgi:hypothetical protein
MAHGTHDARAFFFHREEVLSSRVFANYAQVFSIFYFFRALKLTLEELMWELH